MQGLESFAPLEELQRSSTLYTWGPFNPITQFLSDTNTKIIEMSYSFILPVTRAEFTGTIASCWLYLPKPLRILGDFVSKLDSREKDIKRPLTICVVPLPHYNFGATIPGDQPIINPDERYGYNILDYMNTSAFLGSTLNDDYSNDLFRKGDTVFNVLLDYKWRKFARWRFWLMICPVHITYYITYSTGVLFPQELYGYTAGTSSVKDDSRHLVSIVLMVAMGLVLIGQECRQVYYTPKRSEYFWSGYNWVDILAFIFPMVTLLQMICNWNYLVSI